LCIDPPNSQQNTGNARSHLKNHHDIDLDEEESALKKATQLSIHAAMANQAIKSHEEIEQKIQEGINAGLCVDRGAVNRALVALITRRCLPTRIVRWPEFRALLYAINPMSLAAVPTSDSTLAKRVTITYGLQKDAIATHLAKAKSLIHLTTDTWSCDVVKKEYQAITARWVSHEKHCIKKALLALKEMPDGHAGEKVAKVVFDCLSEYRITNKLGFITSDNHGANDTLNQHLSEGLAVLDEPVEWDPTRYRLRGLGHILNIAGQAFMTASSKARIQEAIEYVTSQSQDVDVEEQLANSDDGWQTAECIDKSRRFVVWILSTYQLQTLWKDRVGCRIIAPNSTRWNSWFAMLACIYKHKSQVNIIMAENDACSDFTLTREDWQLIKHTLDILEPLYKATKQCEGDQVTLDQMQFHLDVIRHHLDTSSKRFSNYPAILTAITNCWYAFDKYYDKVDETPAYAAAILLHPSRRLAYLEKAWKKQWVKSSTKLVKEFWTESYKDKATVTTSTPTTSTQVTEEPSAQAMFERFIAGVPPKDELESFVKGDQIHGITSPIEWWLQPSQQQQYPCLSRMAVDILSAHAMSADSERVFSGCRRTLDWTNSRLSSSSLERNECMKSFTTNNLIDATIADFLHTVEDHAVEAMAETNSTTGSGIDE
jgi:hypothetical protein